MNCAHGVSEPILGTARLWKPRAITAPFHDAQLSAEGGHCRATVSFELTCCAIMEDTPGNPTDSTKYSLHRITGSKKQNPRGTMRRWPVACSPSSRLFRSCYAWRPWCCGRAVIGLPKHMIGSLAGGRGELRFRGGRCTSTKSGRYPAPKLKSRRPRPDISGSLPTGWLLATVGQANPACATREVAWASGGSSPTVELPTASRCPPRRRRPARRLAP